MADFITIPNVGIVRTFSIEPSAAPMSLVATVLSGSSVKLDWLDVSDNELEFSIEQDGVEIDTVDPNVETYTVTGLTAGTIYAFRVRSRSLGGYSDYSNTETVTPLHQRGYPTFTANGVESDVAAQFLFDEASGNIVDEVGAVTLTANGSLDYQQTGTGAWANFSGIKFTSNLEYFDKNSATASLALGTGNFTIEWVMQLSITAQDSTVCYNLGATHGYVLMLQGTNKGYFYFEASDGSTTSWQPNITTPFDGAIHKYRFVGSGRGTAQAKIEFFMDGVSQGSTAFTAMNGKSIPAGRALFGWNQSAAYKCDGTIREWRLSNNATNNSGGPGGG